MLCSVLAHDQWGCTDAAKSRTDERDNCLRLYSVYQCDGFTPLHGRHRTSTTILFYRSLFYNTQNRQVGVVLATHFAPYTRYEVTKAAVPDQAKTPGQAGSLSATHRSSPLDTTPLPVCIFPIFARCKLRRHVLPAIIHHFLFQFSFSPRDLIQ